MAEFDGKCRAGIKIRKIKIPVTACLAFVALITAGWLQSLEAQQRALGVCEALNSVRDHQAVTIHAAIASTRHATFLFEGTAENPCPGWPTRFFTAPAVIPVLLSYPGVRGWDGLSRANLDFMVRLKNMQRADRSKRQIVTVTGVFIRNGSLLSFRKADGSYFRWGDDFFGGAAAFLVATEPIEDR